jgi:hypothetical protein
LEVLGKESGEKEDPGQNRKINGQTDQDKDLPVRLGKTNLLTIENGCAKKRKIM